MNDKDTKLLEEAYKKLNEVNEMDYKTITIHDETSLNPTRVMIIKNEDDSLTVRFGHSYTLSHINKNDLVRLADLFKKMAANPDDDIDLPDPWNPNTDESGFEYEYK